MAAISVIMPVYNAERYLRDSVYSILNQTFSDFELLIFDDASTDNTDAVLRELAAEDQRVTTFSGKTNLGQARALNFLIDKSRSSLIAIQDADDISLPERLRCQHQYFQSHPQIVLLGTEAFKIDDEGTIGGKKKCYRTLSHIKWHLLFNNAFLHTSVMVRKKAILEADCYQNLECSQDYDLWSRIVFTDNHAANLPSPLVKLRTHSKSKSRQETTARLQREIASRIAYNNYKTWINGILSYEQYVVITQTFNGTIKNVSTYVQSLLLYGFLMFELVKKTKSVYYPFCAYPKKSLWIFNKYLYKP